MTWDAIGSIGTALAVLTAAWQVRRNTLQATTNFEDDLSREYRDLVRSIPVELHLGAQIPDEEFQSVFPRLFQYIDLSNEQVFLRMSGGISRTTWHQWNDGIRANLAQPAFVRAWDDAKVRPGGRFAELRRLESTTFSEDPRTWLTMGQRLRQYWSA